MTCDICYKRFTVTGDHVPHLFPCGHCYCSKCLTTWFKCRGSTPCPGCRNQFHIHNPLSLPKNYKLMEVIEEEKRKSRIRKQNQRNKETTEMQVFEELAVKFCFQSERLLDVIGEVEKAQHRTIISKQMEKLRVLSTRLSKFQDIVHDENTTKTTKPRNRRNSQSSIQTKQRWRY